MKSKPEEYDALLIGAGVMSATLGSLLKYLRPHWKIKMVERANQCATESSMSSNNAGTGHSGFCELNYDLHKAIETCEAFEKSKQFWAYLAKNGEMEKDFIRQVPHISFVKGKENVDKLYQRYLEMKKICLFSDMEFSDDFKTIKSWCPLMMEGRSENEPVAATRMNRGVDVDFKALTENLIDSLLDHDNFHIHYSAEVLDLKKNSTDNKWYATIKSLPTKEISTIKASFVFIGAGGASLSLLQKSGIPEAKGYGGFPVSGQFLMCDNPEVVWQHWAKVYGKPEIGAPPMSVPHLDTRIINGKRVLLFGPYAGFTTKFLKFGHWTDFFKSLRLTNIFVILFAGLRNLGLSKYLLTEVIRTRKGRFKELLKYYPEADIKDWVLLKAGQRVQVIKKDKGISTIEFGTEIVTSADGSLAALLGASPGASTSVKIMIDLIEKCFREENESAPWTWNIGKIIPSCDTYLHKDIELFNEVEKMTAEALGLNSHECIL